MTSPRPITPPRIETPRNDPSRTAAPARTFVASTATASSSTTSSSSPSSSSSSSSPTTPALYVVVDDGSFAARVRTSGPGVAHAALRNRTTARDVVGALAHDLLTDLGHTGQRAADAGTDHATRVLPAYLRTHDTDTLLITGADRLARHPRTTLDDIARDIRGLAAAANITTVWLAGDGTAPRLFEPTAALTPTEAVKHWTLNLPTRRDKLLDDGTPADEPDGFPAVPGDEALTFLSSVNELLDRDDAARVRATAWAAHARAIRQCTPYLPGQPRHQDGIIARPWVIHYVRSELEHTHSVDEAVTVLRGIQLACFHAGWWLTVDIDDFVSAYLASPPPADHNPGDWDKLMSYRTPHVPAIVGLAAAGVSRAGLETITPSHIAPDFTWVSEGWRRHHIPVTARLYIRAQVEQLNTAVFADDPPVKQPPVATVIDNTGRLVPATSGQVQRALNAPKNDHAIELTGRPREWALRNETAFARRFHINLFPISSTARRAAKTNEPWRST